MPSIQAEAGHPGRAGRLTTARNLKTLNVTGYGFFEFDDASGSPCLTWRCWPLPEEFGAGTTASAEPVEPVRALHGVEDCRRPAGRRRSLVEALSMPGLADIDFEPPRVRIEAAVPDLS